LLRNSFIHIPGIGPSTERWLWNNGLRNWSDCSSRKTARLCGFPMTSTLRAYAQESETNLRNGNALYFDRLLPKTESWRMYADFCNNTAFIDIETTGFRGLEEITVIGLSDGRRTKVFINGTNLADFKDEIRKYTLMVTYNGKQFDLPVMYRTFGNIFAHIAHLDLRYTFQRLGYVGGLKTIQEQLGFRRDGLLNYLDGRSAIWLWEEYRKGNKKALNTLVRYNLEDVVVLQSLAEAVYNEASSALPLVVKSLPLGNKPPIDVRYDEELVRKLARKARLVPYETGDS
jgi:uncharacterized protein